jgi:hypothetical protein
LTRISPLALLLAGGASGFDASESPIAGKGWGVSGCVTSGLSPSS